MKRVLITYVGSSRTRLIPQPKLIKAMAVARSKERREQAVVITGPVHRSPMTDGPADMWTWNGKVSDIKCWKRNNKHAKRNWQRHPGRTHSKPKGQGRRRHIHYYSPSARLLYQQDLFSEMGLSE